MGSIHEASSRGPCHDEELGKKSDTTSLKPQLSATDQSGRSKSATISSQGSDESRPDSSLIGVHRLSFTNPTTSSLTRFNLKKYDEKQEHHLDGRDTDSGHRQCQLGDLQNILSDLGLKSSDDLIARMMPASSGETPMTSFLSEKNDQTLQDKVYSRRFRTQGQAENL